MALTQVYNHEGGMRALMIDRWYNFGGKRRIVRMVLVMCEVCHRVDYDLMRRIPQPSRSRFVVVEYYIS